MQERFAVFARRFGMAAGAVLLLGQAWRSRPYPMEPPATAIDNTRKVLPAFRRLTRFLVELRPALPRGATVSLLAEGAGTGGESQYDDYLNFLVALGQWPDARVVFPSFRWPKTSAPSPPPDYVATFEGAFSDPRYRPVFRGELGMLYRRKR